MTIGVDVSTAFSKMVMCSATSNIILKKMCYLYISNYARSNLNIALLMINLLQKDCKDEDPMIRGLVLRSLCSLRVENLVEYLMSPLMEGLEDGNGYVRMVSTIRVLKLFRILLASCLDLGFPAMLKALMLNDPNAQVVANYLSALQEIWNLEAGSEEVSSKREALLSKPIVYYLLNRFDSYLFQWRSSTWVISSLSLVYECIKAPLLTLVSTGSPEQSFTVLSHLHLLVMRSPMFFSLDYKHFYCYYSQPSYVKKLKLEMLTAIANESNSYEIVTELREYAANMDIPIARESIRAVGKIALQQNDVNAIINRLL